jgi:hypothetical protein
MNPPSSYNEAGLPPAGDLEPGLSGFRGVSRGIMFLGAGLSSHNENFLHNISGDGIVPAKLKLREQLRWQSHEC